MGQFRLAATASMDLERLYRDGVAGFGLADADRYYEGLFDTFEFLASYPRAARLRQEIEPPARAYRYGSHVIVYDLGPDDMVIVLRIRHGREDWQAEASSH